MRADAQRSIAVPHVPGEVVKPRQTSLVAHRSHRLRHASRVQTRRVTSLVRGHAAAFRVLRRQLGVEQQLFLEIAILPAAADGPQKTCIHSRRRGIGFASYSSRRAVSG
jgi:hypothetical protein